LNGLERREEERRDEGDDAGTNGYLTAWAKSVDSPKIEMKTEYATTLARTDGTSASVSKSSR
jgi:hypothetical protein